MSKFLLLFLFLPQILLAQEAVKPVVSQDYLSLIKGDGLEKKLVIKADSMRIMQLKFVYTPVRPVARLKIANGQLGIEPLFKQYIEFGGTFTSSFSVKSINSTPALQNSFAQGRGVGGVAQWQGPETGEMFSYGPALTQLEYDGVGYAYDANGKLVATGTGNGLAAMAFDNGIFKNGLSQNQLLSIRISKAGKYNDGWTLHLKGGTGQEGMVIRHNQNSFHNITSNLTANIQKFTFSGGYTAFQSQFSNENRGGYLNRAYQNSLLTPSTFDNSQGHLLLTAMQRTYGSHSDHPNFLLTDNGHNAKTLQQTGNLSAKFKLDELTISASAIVEETDQQSNESLKTGTAFFPNGFPLLREKEDYRFVLDGLASYTIHGDWLTSTAKIGFTRAANKTDIAYLPNPKNYNYKRAVNEVLFAYQTYTNRRGIHAVLNAGNKIYNSTTATKTGYFLPSVDGFIQFYRLLNWGLGPLKIAATYNKFYTEPSLSTSYAYYSLTQLAPIDAFKFLPNTEASSFAQLQPIQNAEFTTKLELGDGYPFQLTASYFLRDTKDEVFPVNQSGNIVLKNLANVRFNGYEIELSQRSKWSNRFNFSSRLSFYKWTNEVTKVAGGYDYTPIAGFSNINEALVEGQPVGAIVGNSYLTNQNGQTLIGTDGFPLANPVLRVIGNPIPDFTIKASQGFSFKEILTVNLDWEYQKGGDIWNGTRAMLAYYGRSEETAKERTITNYLFDGLTTTGQVNTLPVSFYDPGKPLDQAKWVRYGPTGVASDYIEKADAVRLRNISITYTLPIKKIAQKIRFTAYAQNLIIWSAYQGADPDQLLFDQANARGLDFFNLPSTKTFGLNVSVQF